MARASLPLPPGRWVAQRMALCVPLVLLAVQQPVKNAYRAIIRIMTWSPTGLSLGATPVLCGGWRSRLSLLAANWFIFALLVLAFIVLMQRTPIEEKRLIEHFGDAYREYMQRTGRYLPRLKGSL
jgi:protein-S-isoprenylcysteine O-methyltransferase Ste14